MNGCLKANRLLSLVENADLATRLELDEVCWRFDGTRTVVISMRYPGEEKKEERKEAEKHVKGLWGKVKGTTRVGKESDDKIVIQNQADSTDKTEPDV